MADGAHTHGNRHLTLNDVQTIIGRAIVDESFRAEFTSDPVGTLKKLGITLQAGHKDDDKSIALINSLVEAFKQENGSVSLEEALKTMRDSYVESVDGIIRPMCL